MFYFIGGPARCGKTTLAKRVRKEINGQVVSGDAMVASLQATLSAADFPDLFVHTIDPIQPSDAPLAKLVRLRRRDDVVWPFYYHYLISVHDHSNDDILLEGNLWPQYIEEISWNHKAVFLVDTSPDQAERLITLRDENGENDWMLDDHYTDDHIRQWAEFNILRSQQVIDLCKRHDQVFFDIREHGLQGAEDKAFAYLCTEDGTISI